MMVYLTNKKKKQEQDAFKKNSSDNQNGRTWISKTLISRSLSSTRIYLLLEINTDKFKRKSAGRQIIIANWNNKNIEKFQI